MTLREAAINLALAENTVFEGGPSYWVKPIATVDGEKIYPRTFDKPGEVFFDNNGGTFVLRSEPTIGEMLQQSEWRATHTKR
ncbi:hypothetical protein AAVH_34564 [Aphelenchoides avenae]|nr:hypothetical protein AAVH_34564 [Aphelenchus avenae]